MELLHLGSILFEAVITMLGIMIATTKRKTYGWLIALTFGTYVFYDLAKFLNAQVSQDLLYLAFFIASTSALVFTWKLYQKGK